MRKLEEYEREQQSGQARQASQSEEADELDDEEDEGLDLESTACTGSDKTLAMSSIPSCIPSKTADAEMKAKDWTSLKRALRTAAEAQAQRSMEQTILDIPTGADASFSITQHNVPSDDTTSSLTEDNTSLQLPLTLKQVQHAGLPLDPMPQPIWPTPPGVASTMGFDFGFDTALSQSRSGSETLPSPSETSSQHTILSPGEWNSSSMVTPTLPLSHEQTHISLLSPGLSTPTYPASRRPSVADSLTNNFEGFAIGNGSSHVGLPLSENSSRSSSRGVVDLASRRQRPRPAPISSASLRSRSYGTLSAASPTYRQGPYTSPAQTLRHVKSTGHSLNSHYPGVRKSSIAQKSPLNISTFAQAEYQHLMAQRATENSLGQQLTPISTAPSNYVSMQTPLQMSSSHQITPAHSAMIQCQPVHSPPITPYQTDFLQTSSMLPPSIRAQYATFVDYTPPYSAGPLTNSSWSDAPLTSPDMAQFSQAHFIPPMISDMQTHDQTGTPWMFSDHNLDVVPETPAIETKTQFYIQEFPNQKKEHAQAAQQLSQSRPKHYAFQHHKPEGFVHH